MVTDKMPCLTRLDRSYQIPERQDWDQGEPTFLKKDITWYTDGSRSNQGAGAGMYKARPMEKHYVSLGKLATVFQAELTAIDQCAMRNVEKGYKNRTICIV